MKKTFKSILMMVGVVSFLSVSVNAEMINLQFSGVNPSGAVSISGSLNGTFGAGQSQLLTEDGTIIDAFCVDPTIVTAGPLDYTIVTPEELGSEYVKAAWIWENISIGYDDVVAAQVAIWETTWDDGTDITSGVYSFSINSQTSMNNASSLLAAMNNADLTNFDASGYRVIVNDNSQDFLIKYSVPEPGTLGLMLMGLVCLAGLIRRKK